MLAGLTGNLGCGKTTALNVFKALGAVTVSADEIVHRLLAEPAVKLRAGELLGDIFDADGKINKPMVAALVFNNPALRRALEGVILPLVKEEIIHIGSANKERLVIAEIPLLFEDSYTGVVDKIITIISDRVLLPERLKKRGFSEEDIESRLSAQIPDEKKLPLSDFVINNSGSLEALGTQTAAIYTKLTALI